MLTRFICAMSAAVLVAAAATGRAGAEAAGMPPALNRYVTGVVKLAAAERQQLASGAPVAKLLEVDETKEVAVFGAVWIDAPVHRYVEAFKNIEQFERGDGFRITKRISVPPKLDDFAGLHLTDEDFKDLRACKVGSCNVKLGEPALERFRTEIDWKARDAHARVDALLQQLALEYVTGYLSGGNERLAVYRDKSRPTFTANEFRAMTDEMPELTTYGPELHRYLLEFPKVTLPDSTSFVYWQEAEFGLKPMLRISHVTIRETQDSTVIASKMLYASHYFWTGLELRVLLPDPSRGPGFWFVTINRSRSDGLSGFSGSFVRRRVRSEVRDKSLAGLRMTKEKLETAR